MPSDSASAAVCQAPRAGRTYFTLGQANRALVYISRIVDDICQSYGQAMAVRHKLEAPHPEREQDRLTDEYDQAMDRLNDLIDELYQTGVELKDFELGLVDFPALHEGREIYLCWKRGEERIVAWHELDAGFTGRRDVATLEPA